MNSSKQSQSFINQSIYESHTHHLDIPKSTHHPLKDTTSYQKPHNIVSAKSNYLENEHQKPFIHYYQENIQLKRKQEQMKKQIINLKSKINESSRAQREAGQKQLKLLATGKKSLWDTNKSKTGMRGTSYRAKGGVAQSHNNRKVQELLSIIDHYKSKTLNLEQQLQNLKRKMHLLEQDIKVKDNKAGQLIKTYQQSSSLPANQQASLQQKLKTTIKQLELEKQRNKYNDAEIRRLETKVKNLSISSEQMSDLKDQNKNLQQKMLRLTQLPSFSNVTGAVDEERKYRQLENKYKTLNQKFTNARNDKIKMQAEVKLLQKQLIEVNKQADQLEKQNKKMKLQSIDNPILSKLSRDPKLLAEIYYDYEQKLKNKNQDNQKITHRNYQKIILEKQMLANQITSLKLKLQAMQDAYKEKQRMNLLQKQQLAAVYREQALSVNKQDDHKNKVMSNNGVSYSDDVSMFSQDNKMSVPNGFNYFDLYLGDLHLLETMLKTSFNIHSAQNCLVLATVDFYNHDTQNTKPIHGAHCNLQSEFSFKVQEDDFFIKYLKKGSFYVDIWGLEGNNRHHYGRITIQLKPLVHKSHRSIAPVVTSSVPIYLNQKVMGSINLSMRVRLPIHQQLQKINLVGDILESEQKAVNRRLIIQIQQGRGFNESGNTFIYYPFRLEDHYTKTFRGSNPAWNHHKSLDLKYNNDLKNYLKKNQLELVVIDDNMTINEDGSDVVGTAYVSLLPLLQNKIIKERVQVMKGAHRSGTIDIKIYWHDSEKPKQEKSSKIKLDQSIQEKITSFLKENSLQPEDVFNQIDRNQTGMISYDQFFVWASQLGVGKQVQALNKFYNQFRQPVNLINWTSKLNELKAHPTKDIAEQLSKINQQMFKHTFQIHKKQSFEEFLKGKDLVDVTLEMDKSGNGKISKKQLEDYFEVHGIQTQNEEDEEIQIVKFLKKYQNYV